MPHSKLIDETIALWIEVMKSDFPTGNPNITAEYYLSGLPVSELQTLHKSLVETQLQDVNRDNKPKDYTIPEHKEEDVKPSRSAKLPRSYSAYRPTYKSRRTPS